MNEEELNDIIEIFTSILLTIILLFMPFIIVNALKLKKEEEISPPEEIWYEITIDNTSNSNDLTDYQVLLEINNDEQFFNDFNNDQKTIEAYDEDKSTSISFYVEEWDIINHNAKIWLKVPLIPANSIKKVYLKANPNRTISLSNPKTVFILYDDFDDGDISDWTQYGTPTVTSDEYVSPPYSVYCEIYEYIEKSITPVSKFIFEMYGRYINTSDYYFIRLRKDETTAIRLAFRDDKLQYWDGSAYHVVLDTSINTWYKIKLIVDCEQNKYDIYVNDELKYSGADFENAVDEINNVRPIDINTANPNPGYCDNVIIRKYTEPEPTVTYIRC